MKTETSTCSASYYYSLVFLRSSWSCVSDIQIRLSFIQSTWYLYALLLVLVYLPERNVLFWYHCTLFVSILSVIERNDCCRISYDGFYIYADYAFDICFSFRSPEIIAVFIVCCTSLKKISMTHYFSGQMFTLIKFWNWFPTCSLSVL